MISEEEFEEAVKLVSNAKQRGRDRDELVAMLKAANYTEMDIQKIMGAIYKEQATKPKKEKKKGFDLDEYYKYKKEENILFKSSSVEALEEKKVDFKKLDFLSRYWMIFSGQLPAKDLVDEKTTALNAILALYTVLVIQNFVFFIYYVIAMAAFILFLPSLLPPFFGISLNPILIVIEGILFLVLFFLASFILAILQLIILAIFGLISSLFMFVFARLFGGRGSFLPFYLSYLKMTAVINFGFVVISIGLIIAYALLGWASLILGGLGQIIFALGSIAINLALLLIAIKLYARLVEAYFSIERFSATAIVVIWIGLLITMALLIGFFVSGFLFQPFL